MLKTTHEMIEKFLEERNFAPSTKLTYRAVLKSFRDWLGGRGDGELDTHKFAEWIGGFGYAIYLAWVPRKPAKKKERLGE